MNEEHTVHATQSLSSCTPSSSSVESLPFDSPDWLVSTFSLLVRPLIASSLAASLSPGKRSGRSKQKEDFRAVDE